MSMLDRTLPEPNFVDRDAEAVTRDLVRMYEELTGLTLYPAQAERLMVNVIAYRDKLMREAIQDAAKLNLVRFSRAPILDYLGENIGVPRLEAAPALCTLRFTFTNPPLVNTSLPAGTAVSAAGGGAGGNLIFATTSPATVPAGSLTYDVVATCTTTGTAGNGYVAGQINKLVAAVPGLTVDTVENTNTTSAGADDEDDERLKQRIVLAPEQFSNAGSIEAYKFFSLGANANITDVAVVSPTPGEVAIYPLMRDGLPSLAVLDQVLAACNGERVRPLCDTVTANTPVARPFALNVQLTMYSGADQGTARDLATKAANAYLARITSKLGIDVVPSQIESAMDVYGVYRVAVVSPAAPLVLEKTEWPQCTGVTITVVGEVQG
ncbi:MAG: baseplate J/gp47 family protein [Burkholderiaceae bacterium]|nr:baseplate J/gp47 family protein [Burkholderiaceae bacterium]